MAGPELHTSLAEARSRRGWSQEDLAKASGVSRAGVSAIERGRLVPSTAAALKLAAALGLPFEALFSLTRRQAPLDWAWAPPAAETRAWRAEVGGRRLLFPVEATAAGTLPQDGRVSAGRLEERAGAVGPGHTLVLAGCDPTVTLLVQEVAALSGGRVLPLTRSSGAAIELLRLGLVHVAGVHLGDERGRSQNEAVVRRTLGPGYRLLHLMRWEEGVAVGAGARGQSLASLVKGKTRWVNREEGSGARRCLERLLRGRPPGAGGDHVVRDHRAVAATVSSGWAEAGICVRPVAAEAGLDFLPVQREAYELCFGEALLDDPRLAALMAVVRSAAYRHLLRDVPGWDSKQTGDLRAVA